MHRRLSLVVNRTNESLAEVIFAALKKKTNSEVWAYFCYYTDAEEKIVVKLKFLAFVIPVKLQHGMLIRLASGVCRCLSTAQTASSASLWSLLPIYC